MFILRVPSLSSTLKLLIDKGRIEGCYPVTSNKLFSGNILKIIFTEEKKEKKK